MLRNETVAPVDAEDARQDGQGAVQCAQIHALLADAAAHYRDALRASPQAVRCLAGRGIGGAIAARFGLGFARPKWRDLGLVLERHTEAAAQACGLLAGSAEGREARRFDRFRDRVMFPIRNRAGQVAGFGGRLIVGAEGPKYLNSPEGVTFKKRELLYGLYEAQGAIQAARLAVVVEGYLDVVSVAQVGFLPVVGTLGTACSSEQIAELLTLTRRIVFCFDGDAAGRRAAARVLETVVSFIDQGCAFDFVFLPEGEDPDSFVRVHGLEGFQAALGGATPVQAFVIEHVSTDCDMQCAEGRSLCAHRAKLLWLAMPEGPARTGLLDYCAKLLKFTEGELLDLWRR